MGRVSLIVEANTSDAISKISGLGEAIKKAMSGFDSSKLATWEQSFDKQLQSVKGKLNDLKEKLKGLTNDFKAEVPFGANNSIGTFKDRLKSADEALKTFKATFKDGYAFGAVAQIDSLKSKLNEAQKAIAALNAEAGKSTNLGANQNAKAKKDEITKTIAAVEQLNRSLAKKPVIGATEAVRNLEVSLQRLSGNASNYLSPISFSINAIKAQMQELSQVLNSVQQPTWVEPFKRQMLEVVGVLNQIGEAYTRVRTEIRQPVGESPTRREFQMTDRQAQNLYRTTRMFYRHIRQEFRETRAAATETARAIREAMAAAHGGGTGAGGTGTATAGTRLSFGEQLFSRLRSNLYSYLTMWFGVAGAIRLANNLIERQNELIQKGNELSGAKYNYLGELNLKSGAQFPQYKALAERLQLQGMGIDESYNYASSAAMSGITPQEAEEMAPIFIKNVAGKQDQRALMQSIARIRNNGYSQYSPLEIAAKLLVGNATNPSNIAPTAHAIEKNIKLFRATNQSLDSAIAVSSLGGAENTDLVAATQVRAFLMEVYKKGMLPAIIGDIRGMEYEKDPETEQYRFKNKEDQEWLDKAIANNEELVNPMMFAEWANGRGKGLVKAIGGSQRAQLGALFFKELGDPEKQKRYLELMERLGKIKDGKTEELDEVFATLGMEDSVTSGIEEKRAAALVAQRGEAKANFFKNLKSLQDRYMAVYGNDYIKFAQASTVDSIESWDKGTFIPQTATIERQAKRLRDIESNPRISADEKAQFRETYNALVLSYIEQWLGNKKYSSQKEMMKDLAPILSSISISGGAAHFSMIGSGIGFLTAAEGITAAEPIDETTSAYLKSVLTSRHVVSSTPTVGESSTVEIKAMPAAGTFVDKAALSEKAAKEKAEADKQAARDAKEAARLDKEATKNEWNSVKGISLKPQRNLFLQEAFSVANADMSADLQAVKGAALNDKWSTGKTGGILGQAFYAYASEKTDAATDKKIVEQLVATLNQGGISVGGMGDIVERFASSVDKETSSEEMKKTLLTFMKEVTGYLKNISNGSDVLQTPITNEAKPRAVP